MLALLQDLVRHKAFANASLLRAVRHHQAATQDDELLKLLHHIILANRFWLTLILGLPFRHEEESRIPETLEAIAEQYQETHALELEWISIARESDLTRMLETSFIPGRSFSVAQAVTQVCLHSHGHRAQCSTRLRLLGGTPPAVDFVHWLGERPGADWL
jgi:uncharacterized damage-inducible protein DinB